MKTNRKSAYIGLLSLAFAATLLLGGAGCNTPDRLEVGGAYAPSTNTVPDLPFYELDAAYDLAYYSLEAMFTFERENRVALWKVSPEIKHTLDKVRPQAWDYNVKYLEAREVYKQFPTPANLTRLEEILQKMRQLLATANAVIPKQ